MGLAARNPDFVTCEQQRPRPAGAFAQSDQRLCYSLSEKVKYSRTSRLEQALDHEKKRSSCHPWWIMHKMTSGDHDDSSSQPGE